MLVLAALLLVCVLAVLCAVLRGGEEGALAYLFVLGLAIGVALLVAQFGDKVPGS